MTTTDGTTTDIVAVPSLEARSSGRSVGWWGTVGLIATEGMLFALLMLTVATSAHARRVIVFVWDGMRPDAISEDDTPNLAALAKRGTFFADHHATYPTFTMVNASSLATGSFPGTIGFFGNRFWAPGAKGFDAKGVPSDFAAPIYTEDYAVLRALDDHWNHDLLQAPTLLQRARKAGLRTAVVGKSGPAFLQDLHEGGTILDENVALPLALAKKLIGVAAVCQPGTVGRDAYTMAMQATNTSPTRAVTAASAWRSAGVSHFRHWHRAKAAPRTAKPAPKKSSRLSHEWPMPAMVCSAFTGLPRWKNATPIEAIITGPIA